MTFSFDKCKAVLFDGALAAFEQSADYMLSLERSAQGAIPVNGVSYDISPWHGSLGLSLRVAHPLGEYEDNSVDWQHFDFVSDRSCARLREAADFITTAYYSGGEDPLICQEMAHLIFLAGAEALLHRRIAEHLQKLGINAPVVEDRLSTRSEFYMVFDPDATMRANYCVLVLANRVTARLLAQTETA
jgi:hypothetical protein